MSFVPTPTSSDLRILAPELRELIANFPPTVETATSARIVVDFMRAIPPRPHHDPRVTKREIQVSMPSCGNQPPTTVRLYTPSSDSGEGPFPVVLWMHHGGFFSAGPARLDAFCSAIALGANVVVAAPAFRQTPEHPFPAPFDDAYQVLLWLTSSPGTAPYNIDPTRIAVAGTSAGGTLAVGIALKFHDEQRAPRLRLLVLDDTSFTDHSMTYSTAHNPVNRIWNANVTRYMWALYLPAGAGSLDAQAQRYAVPARAQDLAGLPPTLLLCAQWDDLTNDGVAFGYRLLEAGVPAEIHTYRGTFHVSDKLVHNAKPSVKKRQDIIDALHDAFEE